MNGLFLPDGEHTKLMLGDQIVFTPKGDGLEVINFYREGKKLCLVPSYGRPKLGDDEFPRTLPYTETVRIANLLAGAIGAEAKLLEWGVFKVVFQLI